MSHSKPISVCSVVTDPEAGEYEAPFAAGFYDGKTKAIWWGNSCLQRLAAHIEKQPGKSIVYARDGGISDFYYLIPWIARQEITVVSSRILKCRIGQHQLRDSWAITPFDLYNEPQDYSLYHRDEREGHKPEITQSISRRLDDELALCKRFTDTFGLYLTLGAVSARELSRHCPFWRSTEPYDRELRGSFYFGARNEIFEPGVIHGDIHEYDVRSMYPSVMCDYLHPIGTNIRAGKRINSKTCFVEVEGENHGAFCRRNPDTGELVFSGQSGVFRASIHEFHAGIESGSFRVRKILEAYDWERRGEFSGFIGPMYAKREKCRAQGDYWGDEIYKGVMNASYGKLSQNPARYSDYYLTDSGKRPAAKGEWVIAVRSLANTGYLLWKKPARHCVWMNVATAASITGAARGRLLEGLQKTKRPIYCDTDSIISDGPAAIDTGAGMGKWELKHRGATAAMVRKKVYAIFDRKGKCLKMAHSGCELQPEEIMRAAEGEKIEKTSLRPTFHMDGRQEFRTYTVKKVKL